jgi:hypothetical protein
LPCYCFKQLALRFLSHFHCWILLFVVSVFAYTSHTSSRLISRFAFPNLHMLDEYLSRHREVKCVLSDPNQPGWIHGYPRTASSSFRYASRNPRSSDSHAFALLYALIMVAWF